METKCRRSGLRHLWGSNQARFAEQFVTGKFLGYHSLPSKKMPGAGRACGKPTKTSTQHVGAQGPPVFGAASRLAAPNNLQRNRFGRAEPARGENAMDRTRAGREENGDEMSEPGAKQYSARQAGALRQATCNETVVEKQSQQEKTCHRTFPHRSGRKRRRNDGTRGSASVCSLQ